MALARKSTDLGTLKPVLLYTTDIDTEGHLIKPAAMEQGKSEGFDSCDRPSNLAQIWSKSLIFQPVWPWNLMDNLEK